VNPRDAETLDVHLGDARVGRLQRTPRGASFQYDAEYARAHAGDPAKSIAVRLPVRAEPFEVSGVNLHPFFAGLLPEGLRFRTLARSIKTSEDDLFSLLAAVGPDAIGDVSATAPGGAPEQRSLETPDAGFGSVRFREFLERSLAVDAEGGHASVAGVHPKVSAAMISLPVRRRGAGSFLLKLNPPEFPQLVENEAFFMAAARESGLPAARVELVRDADGEPGLLVERFDRARNDGGELERIHQEDACQLLDRYPADKYRVRLQDVSEALAACSAPTVERLNLLRLQAFSYVIANGDLHAKNVSVQRRAGIVRLTPAYDLLSTLPYGDSKMALRMEGRDANLSTKHFLEFGERNGVQRSATVRMLRGLTAKLSAVVDRVDRIGLDERRTLHLQRVMRERLATLRDAEA